MDRTAQAAIGIALVGALAWGGYALRTMQDAERAGDEAIKLLSLPLERAPELTKLPSARALERVEAGLELRSSARLEAIATWARGLDAAQKGKPEEARTAVAAAQKALLDEPPATRAELAVLEGAIALAMGDTDNAGRAAQLALLLDGAHARAHLLAADVALEKRDARAALARLEALGPIADKSAPLVNRRGLALELSGELEGARRAYERAGELDATFAQGHVNLGRLLRDAGRHVQAEGAFGRALQAAPGAHEAWLGRGLSRIAQGDLVGGALDLEQARALAPEASEPLIALADLDAARGRRAQAIDRYRAALLLAPEHAVAWLKLGNALMRDGAAGEAKKAYERAIECDGELAAAHNGLGAARMALGDTDGALAALTTAVRLDEHDPNPARNLELLRSRMP